MAEAQAEAAKIGGRLVAADWIAAGGAEIALNAGQLDEAVLRAQAADREGPRDRRHLR